MPSRHRARLAAVSTAAAATLALPLAAAADAPAALPAQVAVGSSWAADDPTALSRAAVAAALRAQELGAEPAATLDAPAEPFRAAPDGAESGTAQPDASGLAESGPGKPGPAESGPGKPGPARPGPDKPGPGKPGPGKPGPGQPDPVKDALDAALAATVEDGALAVTARVETPQVRWAGADGVRHLGKRAEARPGDAFRIGSVTKTMVSTLVLQEVERGTWTLGTRVEDVLPGLLPGHPEVTVEHLLSHRSGLPTGTDVMVALRMTDPTSIDEFVDVIGQEFTAQDHVDAALLTPWLFEPGTGWSYSNAGYVVLGMMLEEVTGQDLAHLLRHRVLRPAGLRHTELPTEPRAHGPFLVEAMYTGDEGAGWYSLDRFDPDTFGAAGAATSTTEDLLRLGDGLLSGRLLKPSTVKDMGTPRSSEPLDYGLGVYRLPDPCAAPGSGEYVYGHDGATYGTLTFAFTSTDGARSLAVGVTGRDVTGSDEPLYDLDALLVPLFLATC